jgi:hypothetical protein
VSLTFIVGSATDVFPQDLARAVDDVLRTRFPSIAPDTQDSYESDPVDASGWRMLQQRVLRTLDVAPQITAVDAYQAVYLPREGANVEHLPVANAADPLQVGSLGELLDELRQFAEKASLPVDDVELMQLAAQYLEQDDPHVDLDVQTYIQLMLSAKQASARQQAQWNLT